MPNHCCDVAIPAAQRRVDALTEVGAAQVQVDYPEGLLARLAALRRSATVTPA